VNEEDSPLYKLRTEILPNISYQPKQSDLFDVFQTPLNKVKVVILGTETIPVHNLSSGYAYITGTNVKTDSNLIIDKEVMMDKKNLNPSKEIDMRSWIDQGVLLLNSALTVETGNPRSHEQYWNLFIRRLVSYISHKQPCIWVLWGKDNMKLAEYITKKPFSVKGYDMTSIDFIPADPSYNYILSAPSPLTEYYAEDGNGGFYGCNHFIYINKILKKLKKETIIW
jgi:uracil-DNA glycosylase